MIGEVSTKGTVCEKKKQGGRAKPKAWAQQKCTVPWELKTEGEPRRGGVQIEMFPDPNFFLFFSQGAHTICTPLSREQSSCDEVQRTPFDPIEAFPSAMSYHFPPER